MLSSGTRVKTKSSAKETVLCSHVLPKIIHTTWTAGIVREDRIGSDRNGSERIGSHVSARQSRRVGRSSLPPS